MSPLSDEPSEKDPMVTRSNLQRDRRAKWLREGDMSVGRRLAQIGVLGWILVAPTLAGLFLGRWIDGQAASGIFWTASLLFLGLCLGGWTAWRWINAQ